jgi:hypothetical protein
MGGLAGQYHRQNAAKKEPFGPTVRLHSNDIGRFRNGREEKILALQGVFAAKSRFLFDVSAKKGSAELALSLSGR